MRVRYLVLPLALVTACSGEPPRDLPDRDPEWDVSADTAKLDGRVSASFSQGADSVVEGRDVRSLPTLRLSCRNGASVTLAIPGTVRLNGTSFLTRLRFDSAASVSQSWSASQTEGFTSGSAFGDSALVRALLMSRQVLIEYSTVENARVLARFDLSRLPAAVARFKGVCPAV